MRTANGEIFDMDELTAAHRTLPFGTMVRVTNDRNGKSTVVRINDRMGSAPSRRIIDLSRRAAEQIDLVNRGVGNVTLEVVESARQTSTDPQEAIANAKQAPDGAGYYIQYGSFRDPMRAMDLKESLKETGINTNIDPISKDGTTFYRVHSTRDYDSPQEARCSLLFSSPPNQNGIVTAVNGRISPGGDTKPGTGNRDNQASEDDFGYEYGIQFGAFNDIANAKAMQRRLRRQNDIDTIIYQFPEDDRQLYRVITDRPFTSKDAAVDYVQRLERKDLDGTLLTFLAN
jgi:cell division protein FtsN